ncbi:hypothetical protein QVD17_10232 [Tagetes erecta]|uniref:Uncharacterized protein n=1 Tax=Tagetes erecta TaxID=13708 RepID=A0AAD8P608_TARER|nr:hypothetical protein QVD17_10232 [Tagetes erecta]
MAKKKRSGDDIVGGGDLFRGSEVEDEKALMVDHQHYACSKSNACSFEGRNTNRLDYFSVAAFNVRGDTGTTDYGGGKKRIGGESGTSESGGILASSVVASQDMGNGTGGGFSQIPVMDVADKGNGGGDLVVETLGHDRANGDGTGGKKWIGGEGRGPVVTGWWEKWCCFWYRGK